MSISDTVEDNTSRLWGIGNIVDEGERRMEGMLAGLGNVLYWTACLLALATLFLFASVAVHDSHVTLGAFGVVIALLIWLVGRACRYVLAGN